MNELEKLLAGKAGAKEVARLLEGIDKMHEGITELDGLPDNEEPKTTLDEPSHAEEDAELDDDDMADIGVNGDDVLADLKDAFIDFAIDLATMGNDDLQQLLALDDPATMADAPSEDAGDMSSYGTSADLGDQPKVGVKKPEDGDSQVAGGDDPDALKKEIAKKDARIKELEAQLAQ